MTTTVLMEAVKAGAGREAAHEAIKEHAVAVAVDLRNGAVSQTISCSASAMTHALACPWKPWWKIIAQGRANSGDAAVQVDAFCARVGAIAAAHPDAAAYRPGSIL